MTSWFQEHISKHHGEAPTAKSPYKPRKQRKTPYEPQHFPVTGGQPYPQTLQQQVCERVGRGCCTHRYYSSRYVRGWGGVAVSTDTIAAGMWEGEEGLLYPQILQQQVCGRGCCPHRYYSCRYVRGGRGCCTHRYYSIRYVRGWGGVAVSTDTTAACMWEVGEDTSEYFVTLKAERDGRPVCTDFI